MDGPTSLSLCPTQIKMYNLTRINDKWTYVSEEMDDCKTIIICDSQGKGPCKRPAAFTIPDGAVVVSVSGGVLRDVRGILKETRAGRTAKFVVLAGLGCNDLAALRPAEQTPARVAKVVGPRRHGRVILEPGPSSNSQRPRHDPDIRDHARYESILARYAEIYAALKPGQVLVTMTPIARRTPGFVNFQLSLLESRIKRLGDGHHHINTFKSFSIKKKYGKRGGAVYGGKWPAKDSAYQNDGIHLVDSKVQMVLDAVASAVASIEPDERKEQEGKIFDASGAFFSFAF